LAHEHLTYDDLLRIVDLIKSSAQFSEFRLKVGEIEVELRRRNADGTRTMAPPSSTVVQPVSAPVAPVAATSPVQAGAEPTWPADAHVIRAPMVGTFYRAPEPGAAPFVDIGQTVEAGTIVCIVEVMKLMNSVPAGVRGTVLQVLVDDASPVQAGQPLIVVQPMSYLE
jgi:acetyl-CoA carboxylase biotin carboxyl carrier protein